mgnify:CR=1 FL=1
MTAKTKRTCCRITEEVMLELQEIKERTGVSNTDILELALMTFISNNGDPESEVVQKIKQQRIPEQRLVTVWKKRGLY